MPIEQLYSERTPAKKRSGSPLLVTFSPPQSHAVACRSAVAGRVLPACRLDRRVARVAMVRPPPPVPRGRRGQVAERRLSSTARGTDARSMVEAPAQPSADGQVVTQPGSNESPVPFGRMRRGSQFDRCRPSSSAPLCGDLDVHGESASGSAPGSCSCPFPPSESIAIASWASFTTLAGALPRERLARCMRWPKRRMDICGSAPRPGCFVSMEFGFNPTNRNPGRPFRNAMWLLCSPCRMEACGWAIGTGE